MSSRISEREREREYIPWKGLNYQKHRVTRGLEWTRGNVWINVTTKAEMRNRRGNSWHSRNFQRPPRVDLSTRWNSRAQIFAQMMKTPLITNTLSSTPYLSIAVSEFFFLLLLKISIQPCTSNFWNSIRWRINLIKNEKVYYYFLIPNFDQLFY